MTLLFCVAAAAIHAQSAARIDTSGWTVFRNDKMGFEVKHPGNWNVQIPTGTGPESVLMSEPRQGDSNHLAVQFWIQRNVNSKGVPIDEWYPEQMKVISMPPPFTRTTLGTRPAIRREVTGSLGIHFDAFTSLNRTDVFEVTILQPLDQTRLNPIYDAIVSTVKFLN